MQFEQSAGRYGKNAPVVGIAQVRNIQVDEAAVDAGPVLSAISALENAAAGCPGINDPVDPIAGRHGQGADGNAADAAAECAPARSAVGALENTGFGTGKYGRVGSVAG